MEEPNRLDKLYNFPIKDILIPSLKVGALSGKAIIYIYSILHTLLHYQDPAFVLMDILIVPLLLFAMIPLLFSLHYTCRRMTSIPEFACSPLLAKLT